MNQPSITIITPVYNGEKFIESCIANVAAQGCVQTEHLIIDGMSTDKTVAITAALAHKHDRLRWISERDAGQSAAMNTGIAHARGSILGFLNVDDYYLPGTLQRIVEIFKDLQEPSFCYAKLRVVGDGKQDCGVHTPAEMTLRNLLLGLPYPINPVAYFYHKSLHELTGPYDVADHYAMDLDFLYRASMHAKLRFFDETWGVFRFIEGTKTKDDLHSGQMWERQALLKERYLQYLSRPQRGWLHARRLQQRLVRGLLRRLPSSSKVAGGSRPASSVH